MSISSEIQLHMFLSWGFFKPDRYLVNTHKIFLSMELTIMNIFTFLYGVHSLSRIVVMDKREMQII